ncbi:hypothetical protein BEP19_11850 [Ammoniphilus oxalaticus]|uniref:Fe/B12 periplasmic-binding domain-containing protein n=1 Tax=Ammoniphilus oxalaticus TaxID=66863 RepID=A0A419SHL4_9BACL|nr:ABC transporter substrate-binding protein [Ammoniphilus oxalaticus]RKD23225.1 hypothetical protein BEP19_11850 [Ammoniphilus oxalaticus]
MKTKMIMLCWLFAIIISGCSSQTVSTEVKTDQNGGVMITDHAERTVKFNEPPERIVSLAQGDLEIVYQLGGNIVGRPTARIQPLKELAEVEQVGTAHDVDFEKVVSLKPDLVIGHADLNRKDISTAESLGLKLFLTNGNQFEQIVEMIDQYGTILERKNEASRLIANIQQKREAIEADPLPREIKALIVYGTTESFMAALPSSLSGNLLDIAGGQNIADGLPKVEHYPDYAQLSMEHVIAKDPDVIYFITHGEPEAVKEKFEQELRANPAWRGVKAFKNDQFIFLPFELFGSSPGPKVGESLTFLKESLDQVAVKGE